MASTASDAATPSALTADQLLLRLLDLIKDTTSTRESTLR